MKETQAELSRRLSDAAHKVIIGARYMHYRQLTYTVVALALREEDNEPCVVYKAEYGDQVTFIRPITSWLETVKIDGQTIPRFTKL